MQYKFGIFRKYDVIKEQTKPNGHIMNANSNNASGIDDAPPHSVLVTSHSDNDVIKEPTMEVSLPVQVDAQVEEEEEIPFIEVVT